MNFIIGPVLVFAVLATMAPLPSHAENQPCPMAGKTYKYRFDEFFRGKIRFNQDCSLVKMDFANGPAVFKLQENLKTRRGWIAKFNQGMAAENQRGSLTINETGTQVEFWGAKSRLYPVRDTP